MPVNINDSFLTELARDYASLADWYIVHRGGQVLNYQLWHERGHG